MTRITRQRLRPRHVVQDRPEVDVPLDSWTFSRNMVVRDGVVERAPGLVSVANPLSTSPLHVHGLEAGWVYGDSTTLHEWDGTTHQPVTPDAGYLATANKASFDSLNTIRVLAAVGQASGPWYQPPPVLQQQFIPLPNWTGEAINGALRAYGNFLLALGIVGLDDVVRWSDAAPAGTIPPTWIPAPDNFAGDAALADTPGAILDGRPLGGAFIAYKDSSAYIGHLTNDQFVMDWRLKYSQLGVLSRNCVVDIGNRHVVFGDGDTVMTDGQNVQSLLKPQMRRWLYSNISVEPDAYRTSFAALDPESRQVWLFFPTGGRLTPSDALLIGLDDGAVMHYELGFEVTAAHHDTVPFDTTDGAVWSDFAAETWQDSTRRWRLQPRTPVSQRLVMASAIKTGNAGNGLYAAGGEAGIVNPDDTVTPINTRIERATVDFGEPFQIKHCHRVWPHIEDWDPGSLIRVRVGFQMTADDAISWQGVADYDPATDTDGVPFDVQGRFLSFAFESFGINRAWRMPSFDVDFSMRGRF